jgi:predicted exporter
VTDFFGASVSGLVGRMLPRRWLWLAVAAGIVGLLAWGGSGLELDEDLAAFLPLDDPKVAEELRILRAFRGLETLRVDLGTSDPSRLGTAARAFEAELVSPLVSRVVTGPPLEAGLALEDLARRSLPSLVDGEAVAAICSRLSSDEALDDLLARHVLALNGLEGAFVKDHVRRDPLGLEAPFFENLRSLGQGFGGTRLDAGRIVSADGRDALFFIEPSMPSSRTEETERLLDLLERARARASAAAGEPVRLLVAGGHRAAVENKRAIRRDAWLTSLVSFAAMLLVYALVLPRRWLIPLTAVPLAAGAVTGAALTRAILGRVSAIAVGFGGILLGLADDFVIILYYCYETRSREGDPEPRTAAVRSVARPLVAAGAAIAGAFAALAVSGFPGQRDLAVFAVTSLGGTLAFTLLVQPLLLPRGRSSRPLPDSGKLVRALARPIERRRGLALALAAILTGALGLEARRLRFEDDPRAIDGSSSAARAAEDEIARRFADERGLVLVVARGSDVEAALASNETVASALEQLRSAGRVESVASVAPLLPSVATQERRRREWRAFWTDERRREIAERLARLGPKHHFAARAFEPFLERIGSSGEPIDARALVRGPLGALLGTRIAEADRGAFALTLVRPARGGGEGDLTWVSELERSTGAIAGSRLGFARELIAIIRGRLWACGALGLVVMLAVLVPALSSPRLVAAAAVALVAGLVWSLGVLALTGTPINAVDFLIPVLVLGLSVDYAIFLASGYAISGDRRPEARLEEARGAVAASGVTTLAGMASLLLAEHPAVFTVGLVALLGTAVSLGAVFVIVPALLGDPDEKR